MPQSEGNVLCIEAKDIVTLDYYTNIFLKNLCKIFEDYGDARLLFYYPDPDNFPGWESAAAELDLSKFAEYSGRITKVALIDPPEKVSQRWDFRLPLLGGEFREFEKGELDQALDWIKS